ncbi:shikimate dehydrogenase [Micromonospora sp. WMMD1155]|uniref:shikimate dehydrogenase n=1 Tax=Micromonospora sp. WMMD1155 TaxID=3016094 RepID=UPI00249ABB42|nr:shikimate dehydrogenase [Micromonospora sp. WMMD1155]WFE54970.1 shikimate dehydrogenase [Micromonospora sp. WMMD1155]
MEVTRRAAVVGKPIAHSLSPVIHTAGYAAAGLTGWSYTRVECAAAELPDLVARLGPEWAGLSVTMPGKEAALAVADAASPVAAAVGAANTLVRRPDGSWYADNTDVAGMVRVLTDAGVGAGAAVTVLGAGGTARAALAAAAQLACPAVTVVARRPEAVDELRPVADALGVVLTPAGWADAHHHLSTADLAVSTVPKGVADPLAPAASWCAGTVLFDAIYDPWPTPLAASAAAAGLRLVSGLDLLLAQAVGQFEQFTGVTAPVEAMRRALGEATSVDFLS